MTNSSLSRHLLVRKLVRYILIFFSIRNRRKSDTDQGFDIRESREADTGFCATGSYGEYAAAVL
jgi:hypothetical protein